MLWEYDQSEVRQGAMYKCKEAVQEAVKFWALSVRRTFTVVKSTPRCYDVKCGIEGCVGPKKATRGGVNRSTLTFST